MCEAKGQPKLLVFAKASGREASLREISGRTMKHVQSRYYIVNIYPNIPALAVHGKGRRRLTCIRMKKPPLPGETDPTWTVLNNIAKDYGSGDEMEEDLEEDVEHKDGDDDPGPSMEEFFHKLAKEYEDSDVDCFEDVQGQEGPSDGEALEGDLPKPQICVLYCILEVATVIASKAKWRVAPQLALVAALLQTRRGTFAQYCTVFPC